MCAKGHNTCECVSRRMNEMCVCREEKERGFNFIDWTWLGPCMEGKGEEFPMRSAVILGSEKLLKKDLSGNWERWGGSQKRQARSWCEIIPALRILHTLRIRNVFMFLASRAAESSRVLWYGRKASFRLPLFFRMSRFRILSTNLCSV